MNARSPSSTFVHILEDKNTEGITDILGEFFTGRTVSCSVYFAERQNRDLAAPSEGRYNKAAVRALAVSPEAVLLNTQLKEEN